MAQKEAEVYHPLLPALILSSLSVILLITRMVVIENGRFSFMAWNLALAWLQIGLAYSFRWSVRRYGWRKWQPLLLGFFWLSFLPNSFYLVTDFIHLRFSLADTFLFDAVLCMSFALTGVLLGCISVYIVHRLLGGALSRRGQWYVIAVVMMLISVAIYLGRYAGWNSWDLLANPFFILFDVLSRFTDRESMSALVRTSALFFAFNLGSYLAFYAGLQAIKSQK